MVVGGRCGGVGMFVDGKVEVVKLRRKVTSFAVLEEMCSWLI